MINPGHTDCSIGLSKLPSTGSPANSLVCRWEWGLIFMRMWKKKQFLAPLCPYHIIIFNRGIRYKMPITDSWCLQSKMGSENQIFGFMRSANLHIPVLLTSQISGIHKECLWNSFKTFSPQLSVLARDLFTSQKKVSRDHCTLTAGRLPIQPAALIGRLPTVCSLGRCCWGNVGSQSFGQLRRMLWLLWNTTRRTAPPSSR